MKLPKKKKQLLFLLGRIDDCAAIDIWIIMPINCHNSQMYMYSIVICRVSGSKAFSRMMLMYPMFPSIYNHCICGTDSNEKHLTQYSSSNASKCFLLAACFSFSIAMSPTCLTRSLDNPNLENIISMPELEHQNPNKKIPANSHGCA